MMVATRVVWLVVLTAVVGVAPLAELKADKKAGMKVAARVEW